MTFAEIIICICIEFPSCHQSFRINWTCAAVCCYLNSNFKRECTPRKSHFSAQKIPTHFVNRRWLVKHNKIDMNRANHGGNSQVSIRLEWQSSNRLVFEVYFKIQILDQIFSLCECLNGDYISAKPKSQNQRDRQETKAKWSKFWKIYCKHKESRLQFVHSSRAFVLVLDSLIVSEISIHRNSQCTSTNRSNRT